MQVPGSQGQVLGTIDRQLWILRYKTKILVLKVALRKVEKFALSMMVLDYNTLSIHAMYIVHVVYSKQFPPVPVSRLKKVAPSQMLHILATFISLSHQLGLIL